MEFELTLTVVGGIGEMNRLVVIHEGRLTFHDRGELVVEGTLSDPQLTRVERAAWELLAQNPEPRYSQKVAMPLLTMTSTVSFNLAERDHGPFEVVTGGKPPKEFYDLVTMVNTVALELCSGRKEVQKA
jgi:hypothetical protein